MENAVVVRELELSLELHRRFDTDVEKAREFRIRRRSTALDNIENDRLSSGDHLRLQLGGAATRK